MPKKPSKYGIKIFSLVDELDFTQVILEVYVGCQPEGPYKVSNSVGNIVNWVMKPLYKSGRNLTPDNWYTSCGVAKDLLSKKEQSFEQFGKIRDKYLLNLKCVKEGKHINLSSYFSKTPHQFLM
ncbi:hypothetical protein AVEN_87521-1 [Araneus ventricosus]|uniref:PiggyBac transposable element-derived protein domain-containing protein n=1 Tax=Araneus ventricosus TaxID=182803 RepID=A0A4Y2WE39_ARAVE|nr:hypothetical protein AVEN_87521-1 [Araneus ventricosus]